MHEFEYKGHKVEIFEYQYFPTHPYRLIIDGEVNQTEAFALPETAAEFAMNRIDAEEAK